MVDPRSVVDASSERQLTTEPVCHSSASTSSKEATLSAAQIALDRVFELQRAQFKQQVFTPYEQRLDRIERCVQMLKKYRADLIQALQDDYQQRSALVSNQADIVLVLNSIKYIKKHLRRWMKAQKVAVGMINAPGKAYQIAHPLGVVGVISPWNFPLQLSCLPAVTAFAAGNTVIVKMSELTPHTAQVLKRAVSEYYDEREWFVLEDQPGSSLGPYFSDRPWDFLMFTGSASTGQRVMSTAAKYLTPVMLELGGKSPCILHPDYPVDKAVQRLLQGKLFNAGQVCISPDYVFCPRQKIDEFMHEIKQQSRQMLETLIDNPDYTAMINAREKTRIKTLVDAVKDNCEVFYQSNSSEQQALESTNLLPLSVCVNPPSDSAIVNEEIFGPALLVFTYECMDEVVDYINTQPSPLALYYFDLDVERAQQFLTRVRFGGASVNDVLIHPSVNGLPFGGVGQSGFGAYHGYAGFQALSKMKAVYIRGRFNPARWFAPPWKGPFKKLAFKLLAEK